jgi:undecaprenol kinase
MNKTVRSFSFAARGFRYVLRGERNFQIELLVAGLVILGMFVFELSISERIALVLCIVWVLTLELINTAVERIMDVLQPRIHPYARIIKDVMAAAVLVSSIGAFLVGLIIFLPKIFDLFSL